MRRVVITGMGVVTPIGNTVDEFEAGLYSGKNGIDRITRFNTEGYRVHLAGEVKDFDAAAYLEPRELRKMDLFTIYAMVAAEQALSGSGVMGRADPNRVGVIIGSGIGGIKVLETPTGYSWRAGHARSVPFSFPC